MGVLDHVQIHLVRDSQTAAEMTRWLSTRTKVAIDTETTGLNWWSGKMRLFQVGDGDTAWVVPWDEWPGLVREVMTQYTGTIVCHNAKFEATFLHKVHGLPFPWERVTDTMIMAHVLDPRGIKDGGVGHGLKNLSGYYVDPRAPRMQQVLDDAMAEQKWGWDTVPLEFQPYWAYAGLDTILTYRLHDIFQPLLTPQQAGLVELELTVMRAIAEMEWAGMRLDLRYLADSEVYLTRYLEEVQRWTVENYGLEPGQKKKVTERLLADGIVLTEQTETGEWALTKDVLEGVEHPLAEQVLNYRRAQKVLGTYVQNLLYGANGETVHCNVKTLGTRTARMSVTNPALQTLPRAGEGNPFADMVRDAFIATPGCRLILIDYDQVEMRLLAHFSGDPEMIRRIRWGDEMTRAGHKGYDVHSMNARAIYGLRDDEAIPRAQRSLTKNAGFAKAYGAGVAKFSATAGVDVNTGRQFLDMYDLTFPGVRALQQEVERLAVERGRTGGWAYVTSPYGRVHPVTDLRFTYKLLNYLIQGTAADVLKVALAKLWQSDAGQYMRLTVHDEVVFDVPEEHAQDVVRVATAAMEETQAFAVPLTVDHDVVERWGDKYR